MEKATVWYLTDNDQGKKIARAAKGMGITLNLLSSQGLREASIVQDEINIFIFDIIEQAPEQVIKKYIEDPRIQGFLKFFILPRKEIKTVSNISINTLHLEFIARPVDKNEFLLLLEKSIIVERYREMMKFISKEAETRIETYEGLMDINRKNIFESEKEKAAFEKILTYEKGLISEQTKLNKAISDFTLLRHTEIFDMKKRIKAEEMLSDLRRKEMLDARNVIDAQESVIDYSSRALDETRRIMSAAEQVAELSRNEAIDLHDELAKERELNKTLSEEVEKLLEELDSLKKELG